jgi:hypothetical protein
LTWTRSDGIDGQWSTVNIRVGAPAQNVRVVVSTNSPHLMVVMPSGCSKQAIASPPANCVMTRGGTFDLNVSSTWDAQGTFYINSNGLGLEANLGYRIGAKFGLETVGLGYTDGLGGPVLTNQTVAAFATASPLYLGLLGLNPEPVNFTAIGNFSAPSYLSSLKAQHLIPSLSWSYTAGAHYRLKAGSPNQLIFGGYDTSRFLANSATFTLNKDTTRDILIAVQSISVSGASPVALLSQPIFAFIESTDPNIWLPETACTAFEKAFGLQLDNTTNLYLINDTHYTNLLAADPVVTFRLADSLSGGSTVDINLPFRAFALQAAYPKVPASTYYFPLRKADNDTQYTLGRTFLQEAYLTVDYERRNFSISQATFVDGAASTVISILPPSLTSKSADNPTSTGTSTGTSTVTAAPGTSSGLAPGAIAGIVIGAVALLALCAGAFLWRRRRAAVKSPYAATTETASQRPEDASDIGLRYLHYPDPVPHGMMKAELDSTSAQEDNAPDKDQLDLATVDGVVRYDECEAEDQSAMPTLHSEVFELPASDYGVDGADYFTRGSRPSSARGGTTTPRVFGGEMESPVAVHELSDSAHATTSLPTDILSPLDDDDFSNIHSAIVSPLDDRISNSGSGIFSPLSSGAPPSPLTASVSPVSTAATPARSPLHNVAMPVREDVGEESR